MMSLKFLPLYDESVIDIKKINVNKQKKCFIKIFSVDNLLSLHGIISDEYPPTKININIKIEYIGILETF